MLTGNEFIDVLVAMGLLYGVVYYVAVKTLNKVDEQRRAELAARIRRIEEDNRKRQEETWNTFLSGSSDTRQ